jgi:hypothetical protein
MKIKILDTKDESKWNKYVLNSENYDFSHIFAYNLYFERTQSGEACMFIAENEDQFIAFPLIKRAIDRSDFCDLTSVYGYPGPIFSQRNLSPELIDYFQQEFNFYLSDIEAISLFSRLNPFIQNQEQAFYKFGLLENVGKIIYVDLSDPNYRVLFSKQMKYDLKKLEKQGYKCFLDTELNFLSQFFETYHEVMIRKNASDYYLFDKDYFSTIFNLKGAESKLVVCTDLNDEFAAAAIFIKTNEGVQYHLSATKSLYKKDSPNKLIIDFACEYYYGKAVFVNLGGGLGGSEDSLFQFKKRFSSNEIEFKVFKHISNPHEYRKLSESGSTSNSTYFPAYRDPNLT